jgi:hypothetical protein
MSRLLLYYRSAPESDRWIKGDRLVRPLMRRFVRGRPRIGGLDKVFANLCLGLDRLGVPYETNLPFDRIEEADRIGVLGRGKYSLEGYDRSNPVVAGIGLMSHPSEWPTLCEDYPVVRYLQHSEWSNEIYRPYFGERCEVWPVGIDSASWVPSRMEKDIDILVYDKIQWDRELRDAELVEPIIASLRRRGLQIATIRYGAYHEAEYRALLSRSRSMLFLTEHESQGLAYQECLSSGVPVLAWEQGRWLDPNRFQWGTPDVRASSVPYFDSRCGETFASFEEFDPVLERFLSRLASEELDPRGFILERLTLEACALRFLEIFGQIGKA